MSYSVQTDQHGFRQIATNAGYGDFGRWVDSLPADRFPQLIHLYEWGWSQRARLLESEIADALDESPPDDKDTVGIARELLDAVKRAKNVVTITDGLS